jgi:hypothetical protein
MSQVNGSNFDETCNNSKVLIHNIEHNPHAAAEEPEMTPHVCTYVLERQGVVQTEGAICEVRKMHGVFKVYSYRYEVREKTVLKPYDHIALKDVQGGQTLTR